MVVCIFRSLLQAYTEIGALNVELWPRGRVSRYIKRTFSIFQLCPRFHFYATIAIIAGSGEGVFCLVSKISAIIQRYFCAKFIMCIAHCACLFKFPIIMSHIDNYPTTIAACLICGFSRIRVWKWILISFNLISNINFYSKIHYECILTVYRPNTIRLIEQTNKIRTQSQSVQSINPHHSTGRNKNRNTQTKQTRTWKHNKASSRRIIRPGHTYLCGPRRYGRILSPHLGNTGGKHIYGYNTNNGIYSQYEKDEGRRRGPGAECVTLKSNYVASMVVVLFFEYWWIFLILFLL